MVRVVWRGSRLAVTTYSKYYTGKGRLAVCRLGIGQDQTPQWSRCDISEMVTYVALSCMDGESFGLRWSTWGLMDEKNRWRRIENGEGEREVVMDLVEEWHDTWRRRGWARPVEGVRWTGLPLSEHG